MEDVCSLRVKIATNNAASAASSIRVGALSYRLVWGMSGSERGNERANTQTSEHARTNAQKNACANERAHEVQSRMVEGTKDE